MMKMTQPLHGTDNDEDGGTLPFMAVAAGRCSVDFATRVTVWLHEGFGNHQEDHVTRSQRGRAGHMQ